MSQLRVLFLSQVEIRTYKVIGSFKWLGTPSPFLLPFNNNLKLQCELQKWSIQSHTFAMPWLIVSIMLLILLFLTGCCR